MSSAFFFFGRSPPTIQISLPRSSSLPPPSSLCVLSFSVSLSHAITACSTREKDIRFVQLKHIKAALVTLASKILKKKIVFSL